MESVEKAVWGDARGAGAEAGLTAMATQVAQVSASQQGPGSGLGMAYQAQEAVTFCKMGDVWPTCFL